MLTHRTTSDLRITGDAFRRDGDSRLVRGPPLERRDHRTQEGIGLKGIESAVVDGKSEVAHGAHADRLDTVDLDRTHSALYLTHAKDRDLRLIDDDRRRKEAAAHSVVRDRKGASAYVLGQKLAGP